LTLAALIGNCKEKGELENSPIISYYDLIGQNNIGASSENCYNDNIVEVEKEIIMKIQNDFRSNPIHETFSVYEVAVFEIKKTVAYDGFYNDEIMYLETQSFILVHNNGNNYYFESIYNMSDWLLDCDYEQDDVNDFINKLY